MHSEKNTEQPVDALGAALRKEFDDAAILRQTYELEWVESLRQYKGVYSPGILAHLKAGDTGTHQRSKVFLRLTKIKCDAIHARLMDLLFPASGAMNWEISPTPRPTVHEEAMLAALQYYQQAGGDLAALDQDRFSREVANAACDVMRELMRDQLAETQNRASYRQVCDRIIAQAVRYGTGVLKGPLVENRSRRAYGKMENGKYGMTTVDEGIWPFFESVPIWSIFPDLSSTDKKGCRFVWQEHLMTAKDLLGLEVFGNFKMDTVRDYLLAHADGDARPRTYELEVRQLSEDTSAPELAGKYRVKERWGYLTGKELEQAGLTIGEENRHMVFSSNVWILGDRVIKAVINPIEGTDIPFFFFHFSKDESSFFGEGAPVLIRDCQSGINASARMLVDNAAITSGPIIGLNLRSLKDGEDPELHAWKTYLFDDAQDMDQLMKVWNLQSNSQELVSLLSMFQNFADELSTPRYMYGDQNVAGAGRTASGLSMLMGAANIAIKSLVKSFDDEITIPFITALYQWNLQWSEDEKIKGDYAIVATGSSSLVAKELRAQQHQVLLGVTSNPRFEGMTNDNKWLEYVFRDSEMPQGIVRTEEEYAEWKQNQMTMAARAQAEGMIQAMMAEAEKAGLDPQQAMAQVMELLARQLGPSMVQAGLLPQPGADPQQGGGPVPGNGQGVLA